jgi:hypothetical protein
MSKYPDFRHRTLPYQVPSVLPLGNTPSDTVLDFMDKFTKGDISGANTLTDALMKNANIGRLLEIQNFARGEITDFFIIDYESQDDLLLFEVGATHTLGTATYRVVLNADGEVSGFGALGELVFDTMPIDESPTYISEPITIGAGTQWALNGILTLPARTNADNPAPAVVLVHGSGPSDMNAKIFGTEVFLDIADFFMPSLASNFSEHRDTIVLRPPGTRVDKQVLRDIVDWVLAR